MHRRIAPFVAVLPAVFALAAAPTGAAQCTGPTCHEYVAPTQVDDTNGGPWLSGHTYVLKSTVTVPAGKTLTVQPGAIVKTGPGLLAGLDVYGTLKAIGTAGSPIVFTSLADDTGGDHNGDGNATGPAPGDWPQVFLTAVGSANELEHCTIRFAGQGGLAALQVESHGAVVKDSTIEMCAGDGLRFNQVLVGAVENCAFDACARPLAGVQARSIDAILNCTASGNAQGDVLWADAPVSAPLAGNVTWEKANTLNGNGIVHLWTPITVPNGATFRLKQGMAIKFMLPNGGANVQGTMVTEGVQGDPVVFTTIHDDAIGGDTAGDGPTSGTPGGWKSVNVAFNASANAFTHTWFRYGGGGTSALVGLGTSDVTFDHCRFEDSATAGLNPLHHEPIVTNCQFDDNATEPIAQIAIDALSGFTNNTASGNGSGDAVVLGGGVLTNALTLDAASAFNGTGAFVVESTITVGAAGTLTLSPGVGLKFSAAGASLVVDGVLAADGTSGPIVLTSIHDDQYGGDLNANGGATTPAPGDWTGVQFGSGAGGSALKHVRIRYAGAGGAASVKAVNVGPLLEDVVLEKGAGNGVECGGSVNPTLTNCAIDAHAGAPIVGLSLPGVSGISGCTAQGNGGGDVLRFGYSNVNSAVALAPPNALNGSGVFAFQGDVQINAPGSMTISPGVILKFAGGLKLTANAPLVAAGTSADPVVFTSIHDDAFGGDSGGDGPTAGTPGDWWGVQVSNHAGSSLTNAAFRFTGALDQAALRITNNSMPVVDSTFENAKGDGIELFSAYPTVTGCAFVQCRRPMTDVPIAALAGFQGNTASGSTEGDAIRVAGVGVSATSPTTIDRSMSLNDAGVFVVGQTANFGSNEAVTIGKGVVFRFAPGTGMTFGGTTMVQGTASEPVVFTSSEDDSHGGDATGNGPVAPAAGDWNGLKFFTNTDDSVVNHAIVRYAGGGGDAAIELVLSDATFCDLVVEHSAGDAIDANGNSAPTLKDVEIDGNAGEAVAGVTWGVLGKFDGVSATNNGGGDATVVTSPHVGDDVVIDKEDYFGACIVVTVSPDPLNTGGSISFTEGVVVKAHPGVMIPVKHLAGTGLEKVRFTSIRDDSIAGDTNGDGNATVPAPGDWRGVRASAQDGTCEHALVRYAGEPVPAFPLPQEVALTGYHAKSVRAEFSSGDGVACTTGDNVVAWKNLRDGIVGVSVANSTAVGNGRFGFQVNTATYCVAWNNHDGSASSNYAYTGDHVLGPEGCDVIYSLGTAISVGPGTGYQGNCGSSGWGNTYANPMFVDETNGDLRLKAGSPALNYVLVPPNPGIFLDQSICTPWGITGYWYPSDPATTRDHLEFPRAIDDDLNGPNPMLADLGAYERPVYQLVVGGEPAVGETFTLTTTGPAGSAVLFLGVEGGADALIGGVGYLLMNPSFFLQLVTVPVGLALPMAVPDDPSFSGLKFNLQAAGVSPNGASMTNVFRARILG